MILSVTSSYLIAQDALQLMEILRIGDNGNLYRVDIACVLLAPTQLLRIEKVAHSVAIA